MFAWWYGADTNTVLTLSFYIRFKTRMIILMQVVIYTNAEFIIINKIICKFTGGHRDI